MRLYILDVTYMKLYTVTILQHEYLSIFNKIANFSENLSYHH